MKIIKDILIGILEVIAVVIIAGGILLILTVMGSGGNY